MKLNEIVAQYIALRDKKKAISDEYKAKVAAIDLLLDKVEGALLSAYKEMGVDSIRTDQGTAYIATRTSATVANWEAFFPWVLEGERWDFLEHRVSKTAVDEYKQEKQEIPPGLNYREEQTINVRRS